MKKTDIYYPSADGRTQIHARQWEPETEPKAILQIAHGMVEFIGRYSEFAAYLADHGYLVVGNDHLGHGESVTCDDDYGYFGKNGNAFVIKDIHQLRELTANKYPDIPYIIMGHSMGSFLVRQYITEPNPAAQGEGTGTYADGLAGVIIMGTGWQPAAVLKLGKLLSGLSEMFRGDHHRSKLIDAMAFGANNKKIKKPRTRMDWLTKDESIVDWYLGEDWCTFKFTTNAYYNMFKGIEKSQDKARMANLPEGLPMLFVSGSEDPVGANGEGVRKAYMAYLDNSPCEMHIKMYEGDRHEILNELDRQTVYADLLEWLDQCVDYANNGANK